MEPRPVVQGISVGPCTGSVKPHAVLSHGVGLSCAISVAVELAGRVFPPRGVPADPRLAGLGLSPPVLASLSLLSATAGYEVARDPERTVPMGARTMTEAQALGLLLVVVLFVAYGVWDLSHHR